MTDSYTRPESVSTNDMPQGDDPNGGGPAPRYVCAAKCGWPGGDYMAALEHHVNTTHDIKRKNQPPNWGCVTFPAHYVLRMQERRRSA